MIAPAFRGRDFSLSSAFGGEGRGEEALRTSLEPLSSVLSPLRGERKKNSAILSRPPLT